MAALCRQGSRGDGMEQPGKAPRCRAAASVAASGDDPKAGGEVLMYWLVRSGRYGFCRRISSETPRSMKTAVGWVASKARMTFATRGVQEHSTRFL